MQIKGVQSPRSKEAICMFEEEVRKISVRTLVNWVGKRKARASPFLPIPGEKWGYTYTQSFKLQPLRKIRSVETISSETSPYIIITLQWCFPCRAWWWGGGLSQEIVIISTAITSRTLSSIIRLPSMSFGSIPYKKLHGFKGSSISKHF